MDSPSIASTLENRSALRAGRRSAVRYQRETCRRGRFALPPMSAIVLAIVMCGAAHADRFPALNPPTAAAVRLPQIEQSGRLPADDSAPADNLSRDDNRALDDSLSRGHADTAGKRLPVSDSPPLDELVAGSASHTPAEKMQRWPPPSETLFGVPPATEFHLPVNLPLAPPADFHRPDFRRPDFHHPDLQRAAAPQPTVAGETVVPSCDLTAIPDDVGNPFLWAILQDDDGEQAAADAANPDQPIGPRPPEDINELLIRDTSLLLEPGKIQTEISAIYSRAETPGIVILPNGQPDLQRLRNRAFLVPFSLRYGVRPNVEVFAAVPLGVSFFERDDLISEDSEQAGVLGDITTGLIYQLPQWRYWMPDSTVLFRVTAPTSSRSSGSLANNQATLGIGVWQMGASYNYVKSYDPVVFFGGFGYTYQFLDERDGFRLQRGHVADFYSGLGFAVTDDVSLSAQVFASYQSRSSINGFSIPNSDLEPVSLRLGFVRRLTKHTRIQPFVDFGLTPDAADYTVGLRYTVDE